LIDLYETAPEAVSLADDVANSSRANLIAAFEVTSFHSKRGFFVAANVERGS